MIDIHCHILPSVDDGAKTIEDSLAMAQKAVEEGIRTIYATPHHMNGSYENSKEKIIHAVNQLNERLELEGIPLKILPGQEVRVYGEMVEDFTKGGILPLNNAGPYVLVELPSSQVPRFTNTLLFDLQVKGLKPILVHPERNQAIIEHPDLLYNIVKKGVYTQVTASSLTGRFGKKIQKFSMNLVEHKLTHFIASDAHNISSRSFHLLDAYEKIEKEFGSQGRFYFQENAELLAKGDTVFSDQPERIKKKKFLGLF